MATPSYHFQQTRLCALAALYNSRKMILGADCFTVSLDAIRPGLKETNDENVRWNMRTLLLMSRAGFLNLELEPSSRRDMKTKIPCVAARYTGNRPDSTPPGRSP